MAGTAITLYSPGEEAKVSAVEAMGIKFKPKAIRDGEIVDSYDRNRRAKRGPKQEKLDPTLIGYVKKSKKKVKPGYKRRIRKRSAIRRGWTVASNSERLPARNVRIVSLN